MVISNKVPYELESLHKYEFIDLEIKMLQPNSSWMGECSILVNGRYHELAFWLRLGT